jgi:hypothetical protein
MVNIKDQKLVDLQPSISWDDWVEGLEAIIDDLGYHSDEISESDTEKVQEEKNRNIRLSRTKIQIMYFTYMISSGDLV